MSDEDRSGVIGATEVMATTVDIALMAMPGASAYPMAEQVRCGIEVGLRHLLDLGVITVIPAGQFPEQIMWPSPAQIADVAKERARRG